MVDTDLYVDEAVVTRCFECMHSWYQRAITQVETEWAGYDICQLLCFRIEAKHV